MFGTSCWSNFVKIGTGNWCRIVKYNLLNHGYQFHIYQKTWNPHLVTFVFSSKGMPIKHIGPPGSVNKAHKAPGVSIKHIGPPGSVGPLKMATPIPAPDGGGPIPQVFCWLASWLAGWLIGQRLRFVPQLTNNMIRAMAIQQEDSCHSQPTISVVPQLTNDEIRAMADRR